MLKVLAHLLMGLLLLTVSPALADQAPSGTTQWVLGYYVAYQRALLPPADIGWGGLTHIVMGRLKANADGSVATDFDWDTTNGPALAIKIAKLAHANGKKAILMLGGDDNSPLVAQAVNNHRAAFEANLLALVKAYGYDGLDLDWENTINYDTFLAFAQELRAASPSMILTVPVGAINVNYQTVDSRLAAMSAYVDRMDVMSYAPSTAWVGSGWYSWFNSPLVGVKPTTPVSIKSSLQAYATAGVPMAKLGMGASFYAICYTGAITGPDQDTDGAVTLAGGDGAYTLGSLYGTNGDFAQSYRQWSTEAREPYLVLPKANSYGCRYVSYEDEQSLEAKGLFSRSKGYGGIIIWTINQGYVASHSRPNFLMTALHKGFLDPDLVTPVGISVTQGSVYLQTNAQRQFSALITGTPNTAVTWSVTGAQCGSITSAGLYTAPNAQTSCTVQATSAADPTKSAVSVVTVTNTPWAPQFGISRSGTWWVEVTAKDPSVAAMSITWTDGTKSALSLEYVQSGTNYPVFVANFSFPDAGGAYLFTARSTDNRVAKTDLVVPACNHGADGICH